MVLSRCFSRSARGSHWARTGQGYAAFTQDDSYRGPNAPRVDCEGWESLSAPAVPQFGRVSCRSEEGQVNRQSISTFTHHPVDHSARAADKRPISGTRGG